MGSDHTRAILSSLRSLGSPANVEGMARYGIVSKLAYGAPMPALRRMARAIGRDHTLARKLWATGVLDARILAALIDDPGRVTEPQMERWVRAFDNWSICDGCCCNLFDKSPFAWKKAVEWVGRKEEFVKRAGFVLMAALAAHDKDAADSQLLSFFPLIAREAGDGRNFVRKGVNWALRCIGKRNPALNRAAIRAAHTIRKQGSASARWIAADALRELNSTAVQRRLKR